MAPVFMSRLYRSFTESVLDTIGRMLDLADGLVRLLGPLLIVFAAILIVSCTSVYFRHILPYLIHYQYNDEFTWLLFFTTLLGLFILGNIFYNYYRCVWTDPGYTLNLRYKQIVDLFDPASQALPPQAPHEVNYCRICNAPKPRRVHHCSVCDRCVIKMDHHCPWVNNCIGVRTYPYFVRLLFWVCSGCAYIGITGYGKFLQQWNVCDSNWITQHQGEYQSIAMQELIRKARETNSQSLMIRFLLWISPIGPNNGSPTGIGRRLLESVVASSSSTSSTSSFFSWATYNKYMDINIWLSSLYTFVIVDWFGFRPLSIYFYTQWWNDGLFGCNRLLTVSYAVCVCVGLAIGVLFIFHLYLTLTAQSSIEFYRNRQEKQKFEQKPDKKKGLGAYPSLKGKVWKNKYDFGWRKNWFHTFGTGSIILWILPPAWIGIRGITAAKKKARDVEEVYGKLSSAFVPEFTGNNNNNSSSNSSHTGGGIGGHSSTSSTAIAINMDSENDDDNSLDDDDYDIHGRDTGAPTKSNRRRLQQQSSTTTTGWIDPNNNVPTDQESNFTSDNDNDSDTDTDEEYGKYLRTMEKHDNINDG